MSSLASLESVRNSLDVVEDTPALLENQEEEDDGDTLTPAEILEEMKLAWQNEVASPSLLPHNFDVSECIVQQIDGLDSNLSRHKGRNKGHNKLAIHRMELERLTYLVHDYLRVRMQKIETNPRFYLKEDSTRRSKNMPELLSDVERRFTERYANAEAQVYGKNFLGRLPPSLQKIPVPEPNWDAERVFAQVMKDDVEDVSAPDYQDPTNDDFVSLPKDSIHVIAFNSVRPHVESGSVRLL